MNDSAIKTLDQVRQVLEGITPIELSITSQPERYRWIQSTLARFHYAGLSKQDKGLLLRFLAKLSGYSLIQIKRLVKRYLLTQQLKRQHRTAIPFVQKYTLADIRLLARTDELHETLSGPATKKICERAFTLFNKNEYERLAAISIAHLYNLRQSKTYQNNRKNFEKTKSKISSIGERRKPNPNGQPGFIRIDTVHQGDLDGKKGVYHINAVDEVTQFQIVFSVEKISESYLIPTLEKLIDQFPFMIINFHSDNGSEYINKMVAKLLNKLLISMTKSRARKSGDNALVESKNGSVIRKHLGYGYVAQRHAAKINQFNQEYLNPYLNYHRPCFYPTIITDQKGKQKKRYCYGDMMTPYEKLKSLPEASNYLKAEITFKQLDELAGKISDNESAKQLGEAKQKLFRAILEREKQAY